MATMKVPMADLSPPSKSPERALGLNGASNRRKRHFREKTVRACGICRKRKVRCDVVDGGYSCTNCKTGDSEKCKSRKKISKKKSWLEGSNHEVAADTRDLDQPLGVWGAVESNFGNGIYEMLDVDYSLNVSEADKKPLEDAMHDPQHQESNSQNHRGYTDLSDPAFSYFDDLLLQAANQSGVDESTVSLMQILSDPANYVPPFLKTPSNHLTEDSFDYLWKKGALAVPETVLRNELLRSYIEHVHGYMPIIDLPGFLRVLDQEDGETEKLSLLLFQCVMFAGAAYVDLRHLKDSGFTTRKVARKALFNKARLLYDFDYENDRISIVQSLLLMTFWCETPDEQKDLWYWMGLASSATFELGLHKNPAKPEVDIKRGHLLKRIGWSCFMRDQIVALGMQRPTHISVKEHNVPMLTVEDFDIEAIPASNINCVARDSRYFLNLAIMCIEKAKICLFINRIISTQYYVSYQSKAHLMPAGNTTHMNILLPKRDNLKSEEAIVCDKQLQGWYSTRPGEVKYWPSAEESLSTGESSIMVHRAILDMLYFTAVSALHRPQLLLPGEVLMKREASRHMVQQAARRITTISRELNRLGLVRYLPGYSSTVILPAIVTHLVGIRSGDVIAKQESFEGFCTCMTVMQQLRYNYNSADVITALLQSGINKAAGVERGDSQSGPGPKELMQFLNDSSPKHDSTMGLTQERQKEIETSEEYSPLFSSGILDVINEMYSDKTGGQAWIQSSSSSQNSLGVDSVSFTSFDASVPSPPSKDTRDGQVLEDSAHPSSLSPVPTMRETDGVPWDEIPIDAFDETFRDFFLDPESFYVKCPIAF